MGLSVHLEMSGAIQRTVGCLIKIIGSGWPMAPTLAVGGLILAGMAVGFDPVLGQVEVSAPVNREGDFLLKSWMLAKEQIEICERLFHNGVIGNPVGVGI